jgi:hypothetical protein
MRPTVILGVAVVGAAAVVALVTKTDSAPPSASATAPVAPARAAEGTGKDPSRLAGEVREVLDVPQYTYLRVATADAGEIWAAVSKTNVAVGSKVSIANAARMERFESASLKRTFDVIYFGNLEGGARSALGEAGALPPGHPPLDTAPGAGHAHGTSNAPTPPPAKVEVAPATGKDAKVIAALYAEREQLVGRTFRVRGQIVKLTTVQGKNYYRLRDGSGGDPTQSELVVTSSAARKVGEVVTFQGTVRIDVDVGIGVTYSVILENAEPA